MSNAQGRRPPSRVVDHQTELYLQRSRMMRLWGNVNIYTCESCGAELVTTDLDEGVTPFLVRCRVDLCGGTAQSAMYRVMQNPPPKPTHGWYRPESVEGMDRGTIDHVRRGGLILRELTPDELSVLNL